MKAEKLSLRVGRQEKGMKLLAFLREKASGLSSVKMLKRAIDEKFCTVNGRIECFSTHPLKEGDVVELDLAFLSKAKKPIAIDILYEDTDLIVCDKHPGVVSENKNFQGLAKSIFLVHRLDKETSGCLILAKSNAVKQKMIELFEAKKVRKFYLALVDGIIKKDHGRIENYLGKVHTCQGGAIYGKCAPYKGQKAITEWKCLKRGAKASLLLLKPLTGRTHQLRAHLSEIGHPILGDLQYGHKFSSTFHPRRHLLHAWRLFFPHPQTEEEIKAEAPLPQDFRQAMKAVLQMHSGTAFGQTNKGDRGSHLGSL